MILTMWKHVSYLKRGLSHEAENLDCQDNIQIHEDDTCIVAALADGLGSLKYSALASSTATVAACQWLAAIGVENLLLETLDQEAEFRNAFSDAVSSAVKKAADQNSVRPKLLDCTLAFVYISKVRDHVLVGMIGDSAVCVITEDGSFSITDSGNYAGGTRAVQDKDAGEHMLLKKYSIQQQQILGFILTSDGLDNEIYIKGSNHVNQAAEEYFNALVQENPAAVIHNAITALTSYEDTPFDDDISIVVISRATDRIELDSDPTWLCTCGYRNVLQNTYCVNCNEDFTKLYSNVRFREHGGKAAFFKKINRTPEKEREFIGLPAVDVAGAKVESVNENIQKAVSDGIAKPDKKSSRTEKRASRPDVRKQFLVALAAVLAVGSIIGMAIGRIGANGKIADLQDDLRALHSEIAVKDAQLESLQSSIPSDETMIELADGSRYWGEHSEQIPQGNGIMLEDGFYYIGTFVDGLRNGDFLKVSEVDVKNTENVEFDMGEVKVPVVVYRIISDDVNLLNMPGMDNSLVVTTISKGDIVNGTGTVTTVGRTEWAEVCLEDGTFAWFVLSNAEIVDQTEKLEDIEQTGEEDSDPTEEDDANQIIYVVTTVTLNVRNKPGSVDTKILDQVHEGDCLTGTGNEETVGSGKWVEIVWNDGTAWVLKKNVTEKTDASSDMQD